MKIAKRRRRQAAHQAEASGEKILRQSARLRRLFASAVAISRGCGANPAREEIAEGAQAGEADLHTSVSDRVAGSQQEPGLIQTRPNPVLVGRDSEQSLKLADEMEWRYPDFARDIFYGELLLPDLDQELPGPAEAAKNVVCEQHKELPVSDHRYESILSRDHSSFEVLLPSSAVVIPKGL